MLGVKFVVEPVGRGGQAATSVLDVQAGWLALISQWSQSAVICCAVLSRELDHNKQPSSATMASPLWAVEGVSNQSNESNLCAYALSQSPLKGFVLSQRQEELLVKDCSFSCLQ